MSYLLTTLQLCWPHWGFHSPRNPLYTCPLSIRHRAHLRRCNSCCNLELYSMTVPLGIGSSSLKTKHAAKTCLWNQHWESSTNKNRDVNAAESWHLRRRGQAKPCSLPQNHHFSWWPCLIILLLFSWGY